MIDPVAAILALCRADATLADLVSDRIAQQHKFGMPNGWPTPSKAVHIKTDPNGNADVDVEWQQLRFEARCYGERPAEAMRVYGALIQLTRSRNRAVVTTANGQALVYWLLATGSPRPELDMVTNVDVVIVPLEAAVAEVPIS